MIQRRKEISSEQYYDHHQSGINPKHDWNYGWEMKTVLSVKSVISQSLEHSFAR